jgi:hypothetical protein
VTRDRGLRVAPFILESKSAMLTQTVAGSDSVAYVMSLNIRHRDFDEGSVCDGGREGDGNMPEL